jgi:hypothetical protein
MRAACTIGAGYDGPKKAPGEMLCLHKKPYYLKENLNCKSNENTSF